MASVQQRQPSLTGQVTETSQQKRKVFKFKCTYSATVTDMMKRRGWVEQEDEFSDNWDIFWCDLNQLRDLFITANTPLEEHQRIGHFRNCYEISRKNLLVKNLKRLKQRVDRAFGREEGEKCAFYPTTFVLPTEHQFFVQEFRRSPGSLWIIKPAAGTQGRGIFIFQRLQDYYGWRQKFQHNFDELQSSPVTPPSLGTPLNLTDFSNPDRDRSRPSQDSLTESDTYDNSSCLSDLNDDTQKQSFNLQNMFCTINGLGEGKVQSDGSDSSDFEDPENLKGCVHPDSSSDHLDNVPSDYDDPYNPNNYYPADPFDGLSTTSDAGSVPVSVDIGKNPDTPASLNGSDSDPPSRELGRADVFVMQRYISNPYLIGGRKFDIRFYVLVTSFMPLKAWMYRDGFSRFSAGQFSLDSLQDIYVHLTNVAIQRTSEDYNPEKGSKWSLINLREYMTARHGREEVQRLMNQIDNIVIRTLQSVHQLIIQDRHCFELYGFDVLIDSNRTPWLLEVNASPAFTPSNEKDYRLKCALIDDTTHVLDLEGRLTGYEKRIGGYDLFWNDGPVYANPADCGYLHGADNGPKLNSYLGCDNDRVNQLREIFRCAHFTKEAHKMLVMSQYFFGQGSPSGDTWDLSGETTPRRPPKFKDNRFKLPESHRSTNGKAKMNSTQTGYTL